MQGPCNANKVPCNEWFFPVRKGTQGKPCYDPVLALYGIAVQGVPTDYDFWDLEEIVLCEIHKGRSVNEDYNYL